MELHLVRHGRPQVAPTRPSTQWPLRADAVDEVHRLGACVSWPQSAVWFSSPEPKALQTARLLSDAVTIDAVTIDPVTIDDRLREAERSRFLLDSESFTAAVTRSLAEPDVAAVEGWEPLARTRSRMAEVLTDVLAAARTDRSGHADHDDDHADSVVLVGHGTAFTLLVSLVTGSPVDVGSWRSMRMPDHWSADLDTGRVLHGWGTCHDPDPGLPTRTTLG